MVFPSSLHIPATAALDGTAFHRLARSRPDHRWWRPVLTLLCAAGIYCVLVLASIVFLVILGLFVPSVAATVESAVSSGTDLRDPGQLAFLLGTVCLLWPAAALGVRWGGRRSAGTLSSVAGRLRWQLFPKLLGLATGLLLAGSALTLLLPAEPSGESSGSGAGGWWVMLLVAAALVPFQAAAEEYVFRGLLMQVIGSWLRHPAFAILLPVPLFVLGHGYGLAGQIDVAVFAVAAGWLTWRTGGLEAAIALHVVNNLVVLAMGAVGLADPNAVDMPLAHLPVSIAIVLAYALLAVRWFPAPGSPQRPAPFAAGAAASRAG
ncbi:CPBP family intramembrane metalloprotease [Arthrobacter gandavensis]|uniref:CPBP family intramembrane glutamic endopeptidase n=1 Tax=Arthrobacter gandavensis TaxID=169960 RepID=UPI0018907497|nr:CPBP family intramembrane glutamic endopeptidase [Arthrobacter gandavensis]MBF4994118.1 CPBP family intramembrane metalloprotease [Arthrobacter gandavensis]